MELFTYNAFRELSTKISASEYRNLEKSLLTQGCLVPIITWGDVIIDGHKRYAICKKYDIPFAVERKEFRSFAEAKRWAHHLVAECREMLVEAQSHDETVPPREKVPAKKTTTPMLELPPKPSAPRNEILDFNHLTTHDINRFLHFLRERFGMNCLKELVFILVAQIVHHQDNDATRQLLQQLYNLHDTPAFTGKNDAIP